MGKRDGAMATALCCAQSNCCNFPILSKIYPQSTLFQCSVYSIQVLSSSDFTVEWDFPGSNSSSGVQGQYQVKVIYLVTCKKNTFSGIKKLGKALFFTTKCDNRYYRVTWLNRRDRLWIFDSLFLLKFTHVHSWPLQRILPSSSLKDHSQTLNSNVTF